jgi:RNA polymerase sigma factor (sigma-70 family)
MVAEALSDQSDTQLVEQFLVRHDPAVFEALVRRHGPMVYRVCRRVLQHHDAEDAFQAVFLLLVQKLRTLRKHASLASWLHGVAYRVALKARAAAATRRRHEQQTHVGHDMPLEGVAWEELRAVLDSELTKLPDRWRLPLVLCYLEGQTQDEAATQLGWSTRTLRRRLEEGRTALARRLRRRGVLWPAALGVVLLSDCAAPAAPRSALVDGTVAAATRIAAGQAPATVLAPEVAALTKGVARSMSLTKFRIAAVVLVLGVLAGCALGMLTRTATVAGPSEAADNAQPRVAPTWKECTTIHYDDAHYVFSVALSPGGKTLATGINHFDRSRSGEVALWDTGTGKMHTVLKGHADLVQSLAFSPDGKSLAVGSHARDGAKVTGMVILWDPATGKRHGTLFVENGPVTAVAFAPKSGTTLAAASYSALPGGDITNFSKGITRVVLKVWDFR